MSLVSIIIPAYNQARFLGMAIDSCLKQTHPEVEIIVIDDGSTDDTSTVASRYQDKIRYVHQENRGLPGARNRGIEESKGEFLCFLDSDDLYHSEKISQQVALLESNAGVDWVYCDIETIDEEGGSVAKAARVRDVQRELSGDLFASLMMGGYFPPHTVMVRRKVLDAVGVFDPELGGYADYDLWLRIAAGGHQAVFIDQPLASYRTYPTSMSKDGEHMAETRRQALRKIAASHPDRVAESVDRLQQSNEDLFHANRWMVDNWDRVLSEVESDGAAGTVPEAAGSSQERYSLIRHLEQARMTKGQADQREVWEVSLDDMTSQALLLQPPAEMTFTLPTPKGGTFSTAVAIHPDVWKKPGAGGCEFRIRINGRQAYAIALDPIRFAGDRHWHPIRIQLPDNPAGAHQVVVETRSLGGSNDFRWALWRSPEFKWSIPQAETNPETSLTLTAA